jgi:FlaG/FlaF family flagellin (archaellin)
MRQDHPAMPKNYKLHVPGSADSGVSEVIGAILLISVVIAAVAIIGVILLSQNTPQEIPNVNFMTGTDNSNRLYLFHNGGDSLTIGSFSVLVDGVTQNNNNIAISDGSTTWSLGKNLIISGITPGQHSVAIVYNTTGTGQVVIRSGTANIILPVTPVINPDIITASAYPPVISVPLLMENVTNNSINYYRENGTIIQSGYLQFNVTGINSSMYTSTGFLQLNVGDTVNIAPDLVSQGITMFGVGNQIWELTAQKATLTITNRSSNPSPYTGAINHTWITGYKDFRSTLVLSTASTPGTYYTELAVNNYPSYTGYQSFSSQIINSTSSKNIVISNVKPMPVGLFVLQFNNISKSTYFVGNITSISIS